MDSIEEICARGAALARKREAEAKEQRAEERKTQLERIRESALLEAEEERREIGFNSRLLVQATMPHSKPPEGINEWERTNGYVKLHIQAPAQYGLPYGTYPRLLMAWVTTEAVRTQSQQLELGRSLREFIGKLGMTAGGKQGQLIRQHMQRLFKSTVSATYQEAGKWIERGFRPIEGSEIFWDPKAPEQPMLWNSRIALNQTFFQEITNHPVPVDVDTLRTLGRSPMAIDTYQWLTYRMSYLRKDTLVPWERLHLQFGSSYKRLRKFREKFLSCLGLVCREYSDAKVESKTEGLLLKPSKTHVPMRLIQGGRT